MPTPLPDPAATRLTPPDAEEVLLLSRAVETAVTPSGGLTRTQQVFMQALFVAMTGFPATIGAPRLDAARRFAQGSLELAAFDFDRNGYTSTLDASALSSLQTSRALDAAWDFDVDDESLAERWQTLEHHPTGSLGRRVAEFYLARGFAYPGLPGSAPPLLAQHDWVHVLADYGTTVESELEVFAFIARANDDMRAFSLLAMVVSLFETGYLRAGAGLFESSPGHLSETGMAVRVADAMRRGALCHGSIDFLRTNWFELAPLHVEEVRQRFAVPSKSAEALGSGSVGPWERGGISPFQTRSGVALAERRGRPYDSFGATIGGQAGQGGATP